MEAKARGRSKNRSHDWLQVYLRPFSVLPSPGRCSFILRRSLSHGRQRSKQIQLNTELEDTAMDRAETIVNHLIFIDKIKYYCQETIGLLKNNEAHSGNKLIEI